MIMCGVGNIVSFVCVGINFIDCGFYGFYDIWNLVYVQIIIGVLDCDIVYIVIGCVLVCIWEFIFFVYEIGKYVVVVFGFYMMYS